MHANAKIGRVMRESVGVKVLVGDGEYPSPTRCLVADLVALAQRSPLQPTQQTQQWPQSTN
jgi:hypothetical protein